MPASLDRRRTGAVRSAPSGSSSMRVAFGPRPAARTPVARTSARRTRRHRAGRRQTRCRGVGVDSDCSPTALLPDCAGASRPPSAVRRAAPCCVEVGGVVDSAVRVGLQLQLDHVAEAVVVAVGIVGLGAVLLLEMVTGEVLVAVGSLGVELPAGVGEELGSLGPAGVGSQRIAEGEVLAVGPLSLVGVGVVRVGVDPVLGPVAQAVVVGVALVRVGVEDVASRSRRTGRRLSVSGPVPTCRRAGSKFCTAGAGQAGSGIAASFPPDGTERPLPCRPEFSRFTPAADAECALSVFGRRFRRRARSVRIGRAGRGVRR